MYWKVRIILAIAVFAAQFAGMATVSEAQSYWARAYSVSPPTAWGDAAGCVKEVPTTMGDGYIVLGSTVPTGGVLPFDILMVKLKDNGDVEWVRQLRNGDPNLQFERAYSIDVIPPGLGGGYGPGYIIAGHIAPDFWGNRDMLVLRTNATGQPIWAYRFDFGWLYETATCVKTTTLGNFIVVGGHSNSYPYFDELVVMKLDASGYMVAGAGPHVFPIPEGHSGTWSCDDFWNPFLGETYVVAGWIDMGGGQFDAVAMQLDALLCPDWARRYGLVNAGLQNLEDRFLCIKRLNNGGFITTGYTNTLSAGNNYDMLAMKLNNDGTLWGWPNAYSNVNGKDDIASSIDEITSGSYSGDYIVTGRSYAPLTQGNDLDLVFMKLDGTTLNKDWAQALRPTGPFMPPMTNDDGGSCVEAIPDGYIAAGWTRSIWFDMDFLVCKLHPDGYIQDSCLQICSLFVDPPYMAYDSLQMWDPDVFEPDTASVEFWYYDSVCVNAGVKVSQRAVEKCTTQAQS